MTPQSSFMVVAPVAVQRQAELRQLLAGMNRSPGVVDPENSLVPFGRFDRLHFARIVILDDLTFDDIQVYGLKPALYPLYLAFLGDFDGDYDTFLSDMVRQAGGGLRQIFSCCEDFHPNANLLHWIKARNRTPDTIYVNWIGRPVRQVREESSLYDSLQSYLQSNRETIATMQPGQLRTALKQFVATELQAGRLTLTSPEPTPLGWEVRNVLHLIGVPFVLLLLTPFLLLYAPFFVFQLRRRERSDPEIAPRVNPEHANQLAILEDYDVTNQFSAFGTIKPGLFRRWTLVFILWAINYTTRHIYNRGRLARVNTIHFARWVFLDNKQRLFFASNYDGSLDSYMDDFINKVAFGLNLVFSNGIGYPTTNWLILDGAKDEQKFKDYIRRHELATEVWYNAHPGLTALDLQRNTLIRQGLEKETMNPAEVQQWLGLF
jgi:hypothetical protein